MIWHILNHEWYGTVDIVVWVITWADLLIMWYNVHDKRGILKVLSIVFYLSNRFTSPIMFGIILKSYLSSMLWFNFHEDIIMQTRKILLWIHILFVTWQTQNFSGKYDILPFESVQNNNNSSLNLIILYHVVDHNHVRWLYNWWLSWNFFITKYWNSNTKTV